MLSLLWELEMRFLYIAPFVYKKYIINNSVCLEVSVPVSNLNTYEVHIFPVLLVQICLLETLHLHLWFIAKSDSQLLYSRPVFCSLRFVFSPNEKYTHGYSESHFVNERQYYTSFFSDVLVLHFDGLKFRFLHKAPFVYSK